MNKIVRYDNYLNALEFKKFSASDYNFLMFLCAQMRDQESNTMIFSLNEVRNITGYDVHTPLSRFIRDLESMNDKLLSMKARVQDGAKITKFVLFPTFTIDSGANTLEVQVNERFKFILNELTKNFTQFELAEFTALESKYSKTLYRLLKQYRTTGEYHVKVDELRRILGCPEKYENKRFMQRVINPAVKELQKEFPLLKCDTVRAHTKGRPVTGYHFTFEADGQVPGQTTLDEAVKEMQKYRQSKKPQKKSTFTDFSQREYDYNDLERQLLQQQKANINSSIEGEKGRKKKK